MPGPGTYVHLVHDIPPSRVIEELDISLWVKSNRAGLQLAARVVLPRAKDPRTGNPAHHVDSRQLLRPGRHLAEADDRPDRHCSSHGKSRCCVRSSRPTSAIAKRTWTWSYSMLTADPDRRISGSTTWRSPAKCRRGPRPNGHLVRRHRTVGSGRRAGHRSVRISGRRAALDGSVLTVGGRPRLVRAIDYNGEPFAWLKSLGFNAVRLLTPPTPTQLREAEGQRL